MKNIFAVCSTILLVGVVAYFVYVLIAVPRSSAPEAISENGAVNTDMWNTYTNEKYQFTISYPPTWHLMAKDDSDTLFPSFTLYKESLSDAQFPLTHHSNETHVSVYPEGIPTEGISGTRVPSTVSFSISTDEAVDYILNEKTRYATYAPVLNAPSMWSRSGFLWGGVKVDAFMQTCFRNNIKIPEGECDPLDPVVGPDRIEKTGKINEYDRNVVRTILSTFQFIQETGEGNTAIRLASPQAGQIIESPLRITGEARGSWFFEASFPLVLTDWDGRILAEGYAEAQGDWMTSEFVPFVATLAFTSDTSVSDRGSLILQKANPSGLPENDSALEIVVFYKNN